VTSVASRLLELQDHIRATDHHAPARMALLDVVVPVLDGRREASETERADLAGKLERWRYQLLNERLAARSPVAGAFSPEDRRLADTLDGAFNKLIQGPPRPPRWPRSAGRSPGSSPETTAVVRGCLDPARELGDLEERAAALTRERFGGRILIYAPLYLSSHCANRCAYCGFNVANPIRRRHLERSEILAQARILAERGFRHLLLVAGDFPSVTTPDYLASAVRDVVSLGVTPAVEIAAQDSRSYRLLAGAGTWGVTLYMETYDEALYARYHARGPKVSYDWRLEAMDRAAEAGVRRLGLGILLGLTDPEEDLAALARHADYLAERFPDRPLAFSLPRIHEAPPGFESPHPVNDEMLVRMYCGLRIAFPRAELVLSTREAAPLRDRLARICITQMSAGSSTEPGGYDHDQASSGQQFPVQDGRSPGEVMAGLQRQGLQPVWEPETGKP
jgi:2-iminoacetate synthase